MDPHCGWEVHDSRQQRTAVLIYYPNELMKDLVNLDSVRLTIIVLL